MARAHPTFALRPYLPQDTPMLAEIFRASVEELTEDDYTPPQQEAWAAAADDMDEFAARLGKHLTLIATMEGSPVGFISLDAPTEIGLFYVHPAVARQGVGQLLYDAVEKLSRSRGTFGCKRRGGMGSRETTWRSVSRGVSPRKGGRPVSNSYRTTPSE